MKLGGGVHRRGIMLVVTLGVLLFTMAWLNMMDQMTLYSDFISNTISLISIVISVIGTVLVIIQLHDSKNIQEAEFIVNLNQAFVDNPEYALVYTKLEESDLHGKVPDITRIQISNYLTFFETIYLLLGEKVINMRTLNDLFAYRFFLAVHNETVQGMKLVDAPANFRNIYHLEKIWMDYRRKEGLKIYKEENCLEKACERCNKSDIYRKMMGK